MFFIKKMSNWVIFILPILHSHLPVSVIGYEPADLTLHPPPRTAEGRLICFVLVSSVPKKNVLKGKPEYFGVIQV